MSALSLLREYQSTLKGVEVEEILDLVFFRPLAFLLVRLAALTPVTPNQVTVLAGMLGILAGAVYVLGSPTAFMVAAGLLVLFNVLDCADGMLARMKANGSRLGRILDGISDYIVSIAVYLGIGFGYASRSETPALLWTCVVAAALSNAIQSGLLDFYRNRYLDITRDRASVLKKDLDDLHGEYDLLSRENRKPVLRGLLWIYLRYSGLQQLLITQKQLSARRPRADRAEFVRANRRIMFFWTFLGPTTQISLLIVASLVNRLDLYLWAIVLIGNVAAILLKLVQNGIDSRLGMSEP